LEFRRVLFRSPRAGDLAHVARTAGPPGDSAADARRAQAGGAIRTRGNAGAARRPRELSEPQAVAGLGPRRPRRAYKNLEKGTVGNGRNSTRRGRAAQEGPGGIR